MDLSLKQRLDVLVSAAPTAGIIVNELAALCAARPESACDLLSLVDQYYRRGKLSPDIFRSVRPGIVRHILGIPESALPVSVSVNGRESRSSDGGGSAPALTAAAPASRNGLPPPGAPTAATAISVVPLGRAEAAPLSRPEAVPLGRAEVAPLSRPEAVPLGRAEVVPLSGPEVVPLSRAEVAPLSGPAVVPLGRAEVVPLSRAEPQSSRTSQAIVSAALLVVLGAALGARDWQRREVRSEWDSSAPSAPSAPAVSAPALAAAVKPTAPALPLPAAITPAHPVDGPSSTAMTSDGSGDAPARVVAQGQVVTGQGLSLTADRYVAQSAQGRIDLSVRRTGEAGTPVAFVWWTHGGGARAGRDYVAIRPRQVTVPATADAVHLSIALRRDPARKHTELFYVSIARAPGATAPWSQDSIRQATVFLLAGD